METYLTTELNELKTYATFEKQSEMDATIYDYIEILRSNEEPESVIEVLRFFGRSSLRVLGVSFAKYQTIADSVGYSRRTVIRAVKALESYGIIDKAPTLKKWIGRGRKRSVNVIRILAMAPQGGTSVKPDETSSDNGQASVSCSESFEYKHNSNNTKETAETGKESLRASIPTELYNALRPYFNFEDMYKAVGTLWRAKASVDSSITFEGNKDAYIDVLKACVRRYKARKVNDLFAYLYSAWERMTSEIVRRNSPSTFPNWLGLHS